MSRSAIRSSGSESIPRHEMPSTEEIQEELRSVLASPAFRGSKRCQQFLEYVCCKSLSGEDGALKERMIAVEVFGRRPQSELGEDTIVRVGAREVRKRLAQYHVTQCGAAARIRIELPTGSYAPEFTYVNPKKEHETVVEGPDLAVGKHQPRSRRRVMAGVSIIVMATLAGFTSVRWAATNPDEQAFRRFWRPVFESPEPLLMAVGNPIVYHPSSRAVKLSEQRMPPMSVPMQRAIRLRPGEMNGSDIIPVVNQYVGFGDMVVATELASMAARHSKAVRVRLASDVQFADLRQAQTVLIGSYTNRWTMELGQDWRFRFTRTAEPSTVIVDTRVLPGALPEGRQEWRVPPKDDGSVPEDYILISRIRRSSAGGVQILAAGIKQFGTEAAGRLLSDTDRLGAVLRQLPDGWEEKNLQILLHTRVIGNTPDEAGVVAWHVW